MKELIFVYNADSGRWNTYMDILHKIVSPKTYPCKLCDITHGVFKVHQEWDDFIKQIPLPMQFLHKDEWEAAYSFRAPLPAIFMKEGEDISVWLSAEGMKDFELKNLMAFIEEELEMVV